MMTEKQLEKLMEGYKMVEPKSDPFEKMAETIRELWRVFRASEKHIMVCPGAREEGLHELVDEIHGKEERDQPE